MATTTATDTSGSERHTSGGNDPREVLRGFYDELRALAVQRVERWGGAQSLRATELVHEAWLRLAPREVDADECRAHLLTAAATALRDVLVERRRRNHALKRGGGWVRQPYDESLLAGHAGNELDLLALDEALQALEAQSPQQARLVTLRFFGGLSMIEIADNLGTPLRTLEREWRFARAWLGRALDTPGAE